MVFSVLFLVLWVQRSGIGKMFITLERLMVRYYKIIIEEISVLSLLVGTVRIEKFCSFCTPFLQIAHSANKRTFICGLEVIINWSKLKGKTPTIVVYFWSNTYHKESSDRIRSRKVCIMVLMLKVMVQETSN